MIPVSIQPEPATFDKLVRKPGLKHLKKKGVDPTRPLPVGAKLTPYWRKSLDDLYGSYNGVCAYLAVYFERVTGGGSVDHFIAKSDRADLAYEWTNFRLACNTMNARKHRFADVLDPFEIQEGWFQLDLFTGRIYPNSSLPTALQDQIIATISRLGLDNSECRALRLKHFDNCIKRLYTVEFLKTESPFVWYEANRQGLL